MTTPTPGERLTEESGWIEWPRQTTDLRYEINGRPEWSPPLCPFCENTIDQTCAVVVIGGEGLYLAHDACLPDDTRPTPSQAPAELSGNAGELRAGVAGEDRTTQTWADHCIARRVAEGLRARAAKMRKADKPSTADELEEDALAIERLTAPSATPVAPSGWRMVPVEPTREMWAAAGTAVVRLQQRGGGHHDKFSEDVWAAMLTAAPPRPVIQGEGK